MALADVTSSDTETGIAEARRAIEAAGGADKLPAGYLDTLIMMMADRDEFVRRLVAEGLVRPRPRPVGDA